jgi:hypothetical protein
MLDSNDRIANLDQVLLLKRKSFVRISSAFASVG